MTHSTDHLTPEERELASRLARIGPHGEPSPALDARILSAAEAAVATPPARRRRWPAVLGVAAALALTIGVTWQLRPRPDASPALQEGPAAMEAAAPAADPREAAADAAAAAAPTDAIDAADAAQTAAPQEPAAPQQATKVPAAVEAATKPSRAGASTDAPATSRSPSPARAPLRTRATPPEEPPAIIAAPVATEPVELPAFAPAPPPVASPAPVAAASPPPPSPPPAPRAAKARATAAPETVTVTGSAASAQRAASPQPVVADLLAMETSPHIGDREVREVPVEEDARLEAGDWLDRIRLRVAANDLTGARASLALFRRYYPDRPIPEDFAPLAQ